MKLVLSISLSLALVTVLSASVLPTEYVANTYVPGSNFGADTYTYQPNPVDMYDLDHHKYYTWGINMDNITGFDAPYIVGAELVFKNIKNWNTASNVLYVHLLDSASIGLTTYNDNQGGGDNFASWSETHVMVGQWENNPAGTAVDLVFHFDQDLKDNLNDYFNNDKVIGFGLDPDCHYYNDGITFAVDVMDMAHEPEPATLCLFGLVGAIVARKRKQII